MSTKISVVRRRAYKDPGRITADIIPRQKRGQTLSKYSRPRRSGTNEAEQTREKLKKSCGKLRKSCKYDMNVSSLTGSVSNASGTANGGKALGATSPVGTVGTAGTTPAAQSLQGIGPAATVNISSNARQAMRAAGVPQAEAAKVNINDKNAVTRAIRRAKASHALKSTGTTAATSSVGEKQTAGAGTAIAAIR